MLTQWPPGTVLVLSTGGQGPHAIPVSAAVLAGPGRILIGLAGGRESLRRLRADPRVALAIMAENLVVTVYGSARELEGELTSGVIAVEVSIDRVQDHGRPTFVIEAGVRWSWTDSDARVRDQQVRDALVRLAGA
jgi:Pyridoxamine 5'-phosphate oxidase